MQDVFEIISSLPQDLESPKSEGWILNSACSRHLVQANNREKSEMQSQDFSLTAQYFLDIIPTISPRTRGIIVQMVTSLIEKTFLQGEMRACFSSPRSTLLPELMFDGGICILERNLNHPAALVHPTALNQVNALTHPTAGMAPTDMGLARERSPDIEPER